MSTMCPRCQAAVVEAQRFCRFCGLRLGDRLTDDEQTRTWEVPTVQLKPPQGSVTTPSPLRVPGGPTTRLQLNRRRSPLVYGIVAGVLACALVAGVALHQGYLPSNSGQGTGHKYVPEPLVTPPPPTSSTNDRTSDHRTASRAFDSNAPPACDTTGDPTTAASPQRPRD